MHNCFMPLRPQRRRLDPIDEERDERELPILERREDDELEPRLELELRLELRRAWLAATAIDARRRDAASAA